MNKPSNKPVSAILSLVIMLAFGVVTFPGIGILPVSFVMLGVVIAMIVFLIGLLVSQ